jgi:hypothetical protein
VQRVFGLALLAAQFVFLLSDIGPVKGVQGLCNPDLARHWMIPAPCVRTTEQM